MKQKGGRKLLAPVYFPFILSLQCDGYDDFEDDVTSHIVDALTSCGIVRVAILQTAQMVLVSRVQQVVGSDVQFCNLLLVNVQVCTS